MTNEELKISEELEQLRQQYADLKAQFDKQEITNEKLIRESIRKDLSIVNSKKWTGLGAGLIGLGGIIALSLNLGLRPAFITISAAWILFMIIGNFVSKRQLSSQAISGESTQAFITEIKERKQNQFRWIRINFSIFALWVGYFIGECIHRGLDKEILTPIIVGIIVGAIIGLFLGIRMHNRIIGAYEGIILELENPEASHSILK